MKQVSPTHRSAASSPLSGGEELESPLLHRHLRVVSDMDDFVNATDDMTREEERAWSPKKEEKKNMLTPSTHRRLTSLDIQRGLTIALMIFADEIGEAYPHLNHSPWNNVTMADFVMPWFLFMVGTSMAFSFKKFRRDHQARVAGTKFVVIRSLKLYFLGVLLQGGGWISMSRNSTDAHFGYNLLRVRWCGILERIAWGYFAAGMLELWCPVRISGDENMELYAGASAGVDDTPLRRSRLSRHFLLFQTHAYKWAFSFGCLFLYLALTFLTYVPSWTSHYGEGNGTVIECDTRGDFTPPCCAAGYYDRLLFGQGMLRAWMSARLPDCSSCSPGSCPKPGKPMWCTAHMYDPEGVLATLPAVLSVWLGLHLGHAANIPKKLTVSHRHFSRDSARLTHWIVFSFTLMVIGLAIHFAGFKMNKQLWTPSYLFFMAGSCGAMLSLWYALVDVQGDWYALNSAQTARCKRVCAWLLHPLRCLGMNAILVFFWHGTASTCLRAIYVQNIYPDDALHHDGRKDGQSHNVLDWFRDQVICAFVKGSSQPGWMGYGTSGCQLVFVLVKISVFAIVCIILARRGYFWKI